MTYSCSKIITAVCAGFLMGACGGGGTGTGGVMGASASSLIGVNAETGADPTAVALIQTTGTADTQDGLTAKFGGYTFASDSGFENGAAVENGNTIGILTELDLPTDTDIRLFDGAYDPGNGVVGIYYGIAGTAPGAALPGSGTATWTGSGFANLVSGSGTSNLGTGSATVTADFAGTLSAQISGLTGEVDGVSLSGLTIAGDRFSGSTVQTSKSGNTVNAVGANATGSVAGIFSGAQDGAGVPDEVGGLFALTGDDATLIGGFVAD